MSDALRPYDPVDLPALTSLCTRAFRDDPAYRFLFGDNVDEGLTFLMPRLLEMRHDHGARILVREHEGRIAGLLVASPSSVTLGTFSYLRHGLLRAPASLGVATTMKLLSADRAVHQLKNLVRPSGPFTEALTLAVDPDLQGKGVGTAIAVQAMKELVGPAVLVTTNAANIPLYERFGFQVRVQNGILQGFTAWIMHRG